MGRYYTVIHSVYRGINLLPGLGISLGMLLGKGLGMLLGIWLTFVRPLVSMLRYSSSSRGGVWVELHLSASSFSGS